MQPGDVIPRYALFGQPVAHSRSPWIHAQFAQQAGIAMDYVAHDTSPENFADVLDRFAAAGGAGANVTLPLKGLAARYAEVLSDAARRAGAVNTLVRRGDGWEGDNTDGAGLVADLAERLRLDLRGRRTLVLGAGGAAQGVLPALLDAGVDSIVLANRTAARAEALADRIGEPARVRTVYFADLGEQGAYDFVLNATSAARLGEGLKLPYALLGPRTLVYDMNYGAAAAGFLAWARAARCTEVHDGLGMLVEQAALSFARWHGVRPDREPVLAALRALVDG